MRGSRDEVGLCPIGANKMNQSDIAARARIAAAERGKIACKQVAVAHF